MAPRFKRRARAPVVEPPPGEADFIPVCRPKLAPSHAVLPYLQAIDEARWYTNYGPLTLLLQQRLAALLGLSNGSALLANTGTAAIVAAIHAAVGRAGADRPICLAPAYTFIATASAALQCGFAVRLVDVDPRTGAMDPERLRHHPLLEKAGLVLPVAPYGAPPDQAGWSRFQAETGVPVVIDAAASFDAIAQSPGSTIGAVPVAVSLHATKTYSSGEGGLVLTGDAALAERVVRALNFGFLGSRESIGPSCNGKISEYHAAVGLAELDHWPMKRAAFLAVAAGYRAAAAAHDAEHLFHAETRWASTYAFYLAKNAADALNVERALAAAKIDTRRWYGRGVHAHPYHAETPSDPLPGARRIANRLIGLPMSVDLTPAAIQRIVSTALAARRQGG